MTVERSSTTITKFILLGLSEYPKTTIFLFSMFLGIYLLTVSWNVSLITLIRRDSHLHAPVYFFLSNLSFLDICCVSTIAPKMPSDFFKKQKFISFMGCTMQYFSRLNLTECCLLATMAYDRYAAICDPLLYMAITSPTLCMPMVAGFCTTGSLAHLFNYVPCFCSISVRQIAAISFVTCPNCWFYPVLILFFFFFLKSWPLCSSNLYTHVCLGYHDILWLYHCQHSSPLWGAPCNTSSLAWVWLSAVFWKLWLVIDMLPFVTLSSTWPSMSPTSVCT